MIGRKCSLFLGCVLLLVGSSQSIKVNSNTYEFTIAISDQVNITQVSDQQAFLQTIRDAMTKTSQLLFQVTDNRFYFQTVNIILPRTWTGITSTPTATATYVNADMRVEETMDTNNVRITEVRTINSKPCGQPGEYIILPPSFFLDQDGSTTLQYGDKSKVLIHEFARYRYGVFEEYGFSDNNLFQYSYSNIRGNIQVTSCNNTEIVGNVLNANGGNCAISNGGDCKFRPNMTVTTGPTSSLMFMQFLPTANQFCDTNTHDRTSPNRQNYWCRNRSIKSVMRQTPDFLDSPNTLPSNTNTAPTFNYLSPTSQAIYIVLDKSTHTSLASTVFDAIKSSTANFISRIASNSPRSYVGVATMSGGSFSFNDRLGGYLDEVHPTVSISSTTNQQTISSRISALTRSGSGLLIERAVLDIGDTLSPFTYQSGSIVLLVKLSDVTGANNVEANAVQLLNTRNIRLVTVEVGSNYVLQRVTQLTNGFYFPATVTNYPNVLNSAFDQIISSLNSDQRFQNRRVPLMSSPFTASSGNPARGYGILEWPGSDLEINVFIPKTATAVTLNFYDQSNKLYDQSSPSYSQIYSSWDGLYNVHTFNLTSVTTRGFYKYYVSTTGSSLSGFAEAIQILPISAPIYVGGGGLPSAKPVEVEVYTSGNNGLLSMSINQQEDLSFFVYANVRKGYASATAFSCVANIRQSSTGNIDTIPLLDNGNYPDMLSGDGIFTGYYLPLGDSVYNISIALEGQPRPVYPTALFSLPIDQTSSITPGAYTSIYQRVLPYAASLRVTNSQFASNRPTRILDLTLKLSDDNTSVALSWTAPASSYGSSTPVTSYRLVYSTSPSDIIDNVNGLIPNTFVGVNSSDILSGSLTPLQPGSAQSVTIQLRRPQDSPPPLYFTIGSLFSNPSTIRSFPAPMQFLPGSGDVQVTTTATSTTAGTTAAGTTAAGTTAAGTTAAGTTAAGTTAAGTTAAGTTAAGTTAAGTTTTGTTAAGTTTTGSQTTSSASRAIFSTVFLLFTPFLYFLI